MSDTTPTPPGDGKIPIILSVHMEGDAAITAICDILAQVIERRHARTVQLRVEIGNRRSDIVNLPPGPQGDGLTQMLEAFTDIHRDFQDMALELGELQRAYGIIRRLLPDCHVRGLSMERDGPGFLVGDGDGPAPF